MQDINPRPERRQLVRSASLEALSRRFRPALLGYFRRRVGDAAEAEELVEEVFLRMLRRADSTALEDCRGYLFETASSVLSERARRVEARHGAEPEIFYPAWRAVEGVMDERRGHPGQEARGRPIARLPRSHRRQALAAAGAICLAALAASFWFNDRFTVSVGLRPPNIAAVHYESTRLEPSSIIFADGSSASLDADSAADVSFSEQQRLVTLRRGRATFDVAHDANRPFIVSAGDRRVNVLGGRFQVRVGADALEVVLAEGRASIERTTTSWWDFVMLRNAPVELRPGQRFSAVAGEPVEISHFDAEP